MPGILFADQVIVQSEEIRQIYIDEFQKAAWENGLPAQFTDRKRLEKKFLGLGSPKFDRVARTKREETETVSYTHLADFACEPQRIVIAETGKMPPQIENLYVLTAFRDKIEVLRKLARNLNVRRMLVFVNRSYDARALTERPVSYTHLDVYKRQALFCAAQ